MTTHPLAGKPAPPELLIDVSKLERDYFERKPDLQNPHQLVSFGTSGHRGSPFNGTFTEAHILAITQAVCDYGSFRRIRGRLFMDKDTLAAPVPERYPIINANPILITVAGFMTSIDPFSLPRSGWRRTTTVMSKRRRLPELRT
jgi:hypothetical protein